MVATLNQPQYDPWPMEEQLIALHAGVHGDLPDIPPPQVPRLQAPRRPARRAEPPLHPRTGDRGLAGAFNGQILRRAFALERSLRGEGREVRWLAVGRRGRSSLEFRRYKLEQAWTGFTDQPSYHDAQAVAHRLADLYTG